MSLTLDYLLAISLFGREINNFWSTSNSSVNILNTFIMDVDFEEALIMKTNRLASLVAPVDWSNRENTLSIWTASSLTDSGIVMRVLNPPGKKRVAQGYFSPNCEVVALSSVGRQVPFLRPISRGNKGPVKDYVLWPASYNFYIICNEQPQCIVGSC